MINQRNRCITSVGLVLSLILLSPFGVRRVQAQQENPEGLATEYFKNSEVAITAAEVEAIKKPAVDMALRIMKSLGGAEKEALLKDPIEYARTHEEIFNFPIAASNDPQLSGIIKSLKIDLVRAVLGIRGEKVSQPGVIFCPSMLPKKIFLEPKEIQKQ